MIHDPIQPRPLGAPLPDETAYLALRGLRDRLFSPLVAPLAARGVPPCAISFTGVCLALAIVPALSVSHLLGLAAFLGALSCDAIDGALARRLGRASAHGKLLDQACDTATFCAVLLALVETGAAQVGPAVFAALANPSLLLIAASFHRRRDGRREPRGGFFAHAPKGLVYGALLAQLLTGAGLVAGALLIANVAAVIFALGFALGHLTPLEGAQEHR